MIEIKGKTWTILSMNPYQTGNVPTDLYLLGIFNEDGSLSDYACSGSPRTYRVYESLKECRNGIRAFRGKYMGTLKPVRILSGEVVELE